MHSWVMLVCLWSMQAWYVLVGGVFVLYDIACCHQQVLHHMTHTHSPPHLSHNPSLQTQTGNYTDWLLKSGYFDDTLPLDISKQLSDFAQAAAQQETLLTAISTAQQGVVQSLQQQLGSLATADPAGKEVWG